MTVFAALDTQESERRYDERARADGFTFDQTVPDTFTNFGRGVNLGLLRGAARMVQAGSKLAELPSVFSQGVVGGEVETWRRENVLPIIDQLTPGANEVGSAGKVVGGLAEIVAPLAAGNISGSAVAAGTMLAGSQGVGIYEDLLKQGVDKQTAAAVAGITGGTLAAGFAIPFIGQTLPRSLLLGVGSNLALGVGDRGASGAVLENRGYSQLAEGFQAFEPVGVTLDILMGGVFSGVAHYGFRNAQAREYGFKNARDMYGKYTSRGGVLPQELDDAARTINNAWHWQEASAPGIPANPAAAVGHQKAMSTALAQMMRGERVNVGDAVSSSAFIVAREFGESGAVTALREAERVVGSSVLPSFVPSARAPRGIRNNNPGNIERSVIRWQGERDGTDTRFAEFETPQDGIRALARNALTYSERHGLDTARAIINRWAPAAENDTRAYVDAVAAELGVGADERINLRDPATLEKLTAAIIRHENGAQPYPVEFIQEGVARALAGGGENGRKLSKRAENTALTERAREAQEELRAMAQDAGWQEEGGRTLFNEQNEFIGRTKWVPRGEWFGAGMEGDPKKLAMAIDEVIAGRGVNDKEAGTIEAMLDWLDYQTRPRGEITPDSSAYDVERAYGRDTAMGYPETRDAIDTGFRETSEAETMRALGFTDEEIENAIRSEADAGRTGGTGGEERGTLQPGALGVGRSVAGRTGGDNPGSVQAAGDTAVARAQAGRGSGEAGTGQERIPALTFEQYAAQNGYEGPIQPDLGQPTGFVSERARRDTEKRNLKRAAEQSALLERLRKQYDEEVSAGTIRQPTKLEKRVETARGNPDNESVQAARRLLEKEGYDVDAILRGVDPLDVSNKVTLKDPDVKLLAEEQRPVIVGMYRKAETVKPQFDEVVRGIVRDVGGEASLPDLKGIHRAVEKTLDDNHGKPALLKDIVRGAIEVPDAQQADVVIAEIYRRFDVIEEGSRNLLTPDATPMPGGYRDAKFNIVVDGMVTELQVNIPDMLAAKKVAHKFYEEWRTLEGKWPKDSIPPKEVQERLDELIANQEAIYAPAWARATKAMNLSRDMGMALRIAESGLNTRGGLVSQARNPFQAVNDNGMPLPSKSKNLVDLSNSGNDGAVIGDTSSSIVDQARTPEQALLETARQSVAQTPDMAIPRDDGSVWTAAEALADADAGIVRAENEQGMFIAAVTCAARFL
jgi:hypothetical protein